MNTLRLNSYAKVNLYLEVLAKRKDRYHNLKTVFERIDLSDTITLTPLPDRKIKILSDSENIPKDRSNLAYQGASLLQEAFGINKGVEIKIVKRIPVASGLAGGSSNAASVLLGLNKLWKLRLSRSQLVNFGRSLGSDVPFFIYNCPFALGEARGDKISPLKALKNLRLWHILLVPKINISTARIYARWDVLRSQKARLTKPGQDVKILLNALIKKDLGLINQGLFNSLEQVTSGLYPQLLQLKERLLLAGVKTILMSGSGPAIFGIVASKKEAVSLGKQMKKTNGLWEVFVTGTR